MTDSRNYFASCGRERFKMYFVENYTVIFRELL